MTIGLLMNYVQAILVIGFALIFLFTIRASQKVKLTIDNIINETVFNHTYWLVYIIVVGLVSLMFNFKKVESATDLQNAVAGQSYIWNEEGLAKKLNKIPTQLCARYADVRLSCATAGDVDKCIEIKMEGSNYKSCDTNGNSVFTDYGIVSQIAFDTTGERCAVSVGTVNDMTNVDSGLVSYLTNDNGKSFYIKCAASDAIFYSDGFLAERNKANSLKVKFLQCNACENYITVDAENVTSTATNVVDFYAKPTNSSVSKNNNTQAVYYTEEQIKTECKVRSLMDVGAIKYRLQNNNNVTNEQVEGAVIEAMKANITPAYIANDEGISEYAKLSSAYASKATIEKMNEIIANEDKDNEEICLKLSKLEDGRFTLGFAKPLINWSKTKTVTLTPH